MNGSMQDNIAVLIRQLDENREHNIKTIVGLDGFVDEIIHVVEKRHSFKDYERVESIARFGEKITNAAGLSMNLEFVPQHVKLGGNGPIFANALLEYGVSLTYIGALGKPDIHPVFKRMASRSTAISLCDPAHTDALEFNDGKIMLGKVGVLGEITWDVFKDALGGPERIAQLVSNSNLFGMENWTMIPYMSEIWEGMVNEVFPLMENRDKKPYAFFDLADPEKRTKKDLLHALGLISKFGEKFYTILGLNEKEAGEVAEAFEITQLENLEATVKEIYRSLNIDCLVVHPTKEAMCCTKDGFFHTAGPYCEKPVLTTGAGDNFNAGFSFGCSLGFDPLSSLILGTATSGYYVRNAISPKIPDVLAFLDDWMNGGI